MRRLFTTLIFLLISFASDAAQTVRIAYLNYPPYFIEGPDEAHPSGVLVDYWEKTVAPAAKLKIEWVGPLSLPRAVVMMKNGKVDVLCAVPLALAQKEGFFLPPKLTFKTRQGIIVLKDNEKNEIKSVKELKGKIIGKLGGGYLPPFLTGCRNSF